MTMEKPPDKIIETARQVALQSPCQKSKRGCVVYHPGLPPPYEPNLIVGGGFNGHPNSTFARCDGSPECRNDCAMLCVHAESRALRDADAWDYDFIRMYRRSAMPNLQMVHVKVENEQVVAGGLPSCWQCSRDILESCLGGIWLYEETPAHPLLVRQWKFYTAVEFHRATLAHCNIGQGIGWWREPG